MTLDLAWNNSKCLPTFAIPDQQFPHKAHGVFVFCVSVSGITSNVVAYAKSALGHNLSEIAGPVQLKILNSL
jgi:hypothetical protein